MKDETKVSIGFYGFILFMFICIVLVSYFVMLAPLITEGKERSRIESLFKDSYYNISDDFVIEWSKGFGSNYYQFKDTDWYHWDAGIYNINRPFENGRIELWLNVETMETLYVGNLP